ncbi:helix-turn-helix domain-containing protein [Streptomyces corynorhini]|uniref:XRE family transcriptional regulator n=1 Tax=Streptomyces corynorhini TaxID=2282652 RepID=A0A370B8I3_9ACTN|nr:helix-turn-helix transcriptional regulator [Streptomyces corynorhini]RDG36056.1 XRE family transcriptional regulator [Streptomyces corynorhini]
MSVDSGGTGTEGGAAEGADEPGWEPDADNDSVGVIAAVGRQIKLWRMSGGFSQAEFGVAIGYGENQIYKVEAGKRIPRPEFLDKADQVLSAGGKIAAMKRDVAEARYPRKVRNLAKLEAEALELGAYESLVVHGLLQTEEYARALYGLRRPAYEEDELERLVAARMGRQCLFDQRPLPLLTFVQEEASLRRPVGGRMVWRRQLEHLLERATLRHVEIQVMPTSAEEHSGLGGSLQVLKLRNGTTVGHNEVQLSSRVISDPKEVQILEMRYGMIRSQAMRPRESRAFIEKLLGET